MNISKNVFVRGVSAVDHILPDTLPLVSRTQAWLSDEAAIVSAYLRDVHAHLNAHNASCQLPLELLVETFL